MHIKVCIKLLPAHFRHIHASFKKKLLMKNNSNNNRITSKTYMVMACRTQYVLCARHQGKSPLCVYGFLFSTLAFFWCGVLVAFRCLIATYHFGCAVKLLVCTSVNPLSRQYDNFVWCCFVMIYDMLWF